jgi:glycosyltransferase involved in cell wall biosynthesis
VTKVSVIIPTYNREATVLDAVQSALEQSYPCIEVIVVDDGSNDGTAKMLEGWSNRIKVLHQPNAGPSAARNHGARHASGDVFAFLDSDDLWLPDKIERQIALMDEFGKGMSCCVCNSLIFNNLQQEPEDAFHIARLFPETEIAIWKNPGEVLASRFLLFNQVAAIRRESFFKVGGYNSRIRILEDHDLALRLAAAGGAWGLIKAPLVRKRNDTKGIGVACGEDVLAHARARRIALSGVLESGLIRDSQMRLQLQRQLMAVAKEIRNETWIASGSSLKRSLGTLRRMWLRVGNYLARRRFPKVLTEEVPTRERLQS